MSRIQVNYIMHLEAMALKFSEDHRLRPWHVSLYYALFHIWNSAKFDNPLSVSRNELMRGSKIGSVNTYTKSLKELDDWGYIAYIPSHNPLIGSQINMYRFDKTNGKTSNKSRSKSDNKTEETPERPYINNNKPIKPLKQEEANSFRRPIPEPQIQQDEAKGKSGRFAPPPLEEVKAFFLSNGSSHSEAENFYNYFQSNGWLVGGKAKMKDWNAAAKNWIKRSANFKPPSKPIDRLNTNNNKDYSIPL